MSSLSVLHAEADHRAWLVERVAQVDGWLAPISVDAPAGVDTSYHDARQVIRHEVGKLQSLTGQVPSWRLVLADSDRLLRSETKDLSLAGFLTVALFELHRFEGLALGLRIITGIAERFWESCWPPRTRVKQRANALQWTIEHVHTSSRTLVCTEADRSALADLDAAFREFSSQMERRFGPTTLDVEPLRVLIEGLRADTGWPGPASPGAPPNHTRESSSASPTTTLPVCTESALSEDTHGAASANASTRIPTPPVSMAAQTSDSVSGQASAAPQGDVVSPLHALASRVIDLAQARFHDDRTDPRAYRWLRAGLWLPCEHLPTAGARGRTEVSPPNRKLCQALHTALREERWDAALEQGEQLCRHNPFWLEGHWLSANTLEKLGESYSAAKASLELEVRAFVQRLPRVCMLQFADGSPVCPPTVSAWLTGMASSRDAAHETDQNTCAGLDDELRRGLVQGEADAIAKLRARLSATSEGRARFLLTLELAQALHEVGRVDRALTLYLALEREVEERRLWSWEPECCIQILRALVTLMSPRSPHGVTGLDGGEMRRIRVRLAQLDPTFF